MTRLLAAAVILGVMFQQACEPRPPDEPQCSDVTVIQQDLRDSDLQSAEISAEVQDDLAEMGSKHACTGYSKMGGDKDG